MGCWEAFYLLQMLLLCGAQQLRWTASNFPNPTANEFKRCKMMSSAQVCDPDEVLQRGERYHLNHELHQLESRTRQNNAPDFCQKKGITAAMAIMKHVGDGSEQAVKDLANEILRRWTLDEQCQKSVVFVVATEDRRSWVARDPKVPVYGNEFTQIINNQKSLFQEGKYEQALANAVKETGRIALSKQGDEGFAPADTGGDDSRRGGRPIGPSDLSYGHRGGKGESLLPKLPFWFWIALVLVLIPILCCCCICYCCFCRKGSEASPRRQDPSDFAGEQPRGRSGRGGGLNSFLGGIGGAGVGHLLSGLMRGNGRGGSRRTQRDQPYPVGGGFPSGFSNQGDKVYHPRDKRGAAAGGGGLYPSAAVHDEGGGGGW